MQVVQAVQLAEPVHFPEQAPTRFELIFVGWVNQPADQWDGTYQGELLLQDVFVWQVKRAVFEDGTVWEGNFDAGTGAGKKVGSVLLIR